MIQTAYLWVMKVNLSLIDKLSDLAKLEFAEAQKQEVLEDLNRMVDFVDKLKEIDVTGTEPLIYMTEVENVLREDVVVMEISKEEALQNAPLADSDYFKVPKVLKKN